MLVLCPNCAVLTTIGQNGTYSGCTSIGAVPFAAGVIEYTAYIPLQWPGTDNNLIPALNLLDATVNSACGI